LQTIRVASNLDFWSGPMLGKTADIMVSPEQEPLLLDVLKAYGITPGIMLNDVERLEKYILLINNHFHNENKHNPSIMISEF